MQEQKTSGRDEDAEQKSDITKECRHMSSFGLARSQPAATSGMAIVDT
jgi:hypothetical protein